MQRAKEHLALRGIVAAMAGIGDDPGEVGADRVLDAGRMVASVWPP